MKIAVTGGIGSGKSTVCAVFKEMGYPCFSCDEIYKEIFSSEEYKKVLSGIFGKGIFTDGEPDRKKISAAVFSDKDKLAALNAAAHPRIMAKLDEEMKKYPLSFAEVPLLFECGAENNFDRVLIVYRKKESRILSVMARSGLSRGEVERRMAAQVDYDKLISRSYDVIYNDGDMSSLKAKAKLFVENL